MSYAGRVEQLVGSQELTHVLGVGRARVYQLAQRDDFPEPVARLAMGSIWRLDDIIAWAEAGGRAIHLNALNVDGEDRKESR